MKNNILRIINFSFMILFLGQSIFAQEEKLLKREKLLKDFKYLKEFISAHPDPYTHISEEAFTKFYEETQNSITEDCTELEFYKKVSSVVSKIKDGHSSVYLPENWMNAMRKQHGVFPAKMHLSNDDKLYLLKNYGNDAIPPGSEIITINGIGIDSFLSIIDPYISYENKNFRNTLIDDSFEEYLYLAFGSCKNTTFEYFVSDTLKATLPNISQKDWKKISLQELKEKEDRVSKLDPYKYRSVSDGVGLIIIRSFLASDLVRYNVFLKDTFREIKKSNVHSLIIDIRGNYGGSPIIESYLFHYITDNYFKTMATSSTKVSNFYKTYFAKLVQNITEYKPYITKERHSIDINGILNGKDGSYLHEDIIFNEEPQTKDYEFNGDCYLLTNRDSYSAASSFAATFECYRMGVIIGEETGGTKIFRANAIGERLERSGVGVSMSTTKLATTCFNEEFEGVKPTVEYVPSVLELISEMDTQLLFTQGLIKKVQRSKSKD